MDIVPVVFCSKRQHLTHTALVISFFSLECWFQIQELRIKVVPEFFYPSFQFPHQIRVSVPRTNMPCKKILKPLHAICQHWSHLSVNSLNGTAINVTMIAVCKPQTCNTAIIVTFIHCNIYLLQGLTTRLAVSGRRRLHTS